ncbi:hypothetical protein LWE61_04915 [Sphingobium sufflavum]|uniref:hypothetical protein n=1 Tax=Sphingobium sufflavum TaxID=1129547 RepID=UPI001F23BC5F|nr:hypothetical protein [Sphingobium sufflavum]MCE7795900.1 hypothetical protein [Sphingobium sufflavum]
MLDNKAIFEAIALRKCLQATYNRAPITIAPHVLYRRNDSFFIDAITISRDGVPPREEKVGSFNLAGLSDVTVSDDGFVISPLFDRMDVKYRDSTLFMIDAD